MIPWNQRLARIAVKPLAATPLTLNQITVFTLLLAWSGAIALAHGDPSWANWGTSVFVLARFLDHFDGELARLTERTSKVGHYLDYAAGGLSYAALFAALGIGLQDSALC
ncbi:MAG: hypothetical protein GKR94_09195 [Gammaproteobacteria bacterium]|nr:hypothetical protein [Gammaproteobacteria bacterium]